MQFNELAFSDHSLRVIRNVPDAEEGDLCKIVSPNVYDEEFNDGFLIQNLSNPDYYQVVTQMTDEHREYRRDFDFFIIEWKDFPKYFEVLDDDHPAVKRYQRHQQVRAHVAAQTDKESFHSIMFACAGVCCLLGLLLISAADDFAVNSTWLVLAGAVMIIASFAGSVVSEFWQKVENLRGVKAFLAWLPAIIGGAFIGLLILVLFFGKSASAEKPTFKRR